MSLLNALTQNMYLVIQNINNIIDKYEHNGLQGKYISCFDGFNSDIFNVNGLIVIILVLITAIIIIVYCSIIHFSISTTK